MNLERRVITQYVWNSKKINRNIIIVSFNENLLQLVLLMVLIVVYSEAL